MKAVLITGILGFAGSHLARQLLESGLHVIGIDRVGADRTRFRTLLGEWADSSSLTLLEMDLADTEGLKTLFATQEFDGIVHLAGLAFPPIGWENPGLMLDANAGHTVRLLQCAREARWTGRFLFVSSSDVYGAPPASSMPIDEQTPVQPWVSPYGACKYAAENLARCFVSLGLDVVIARPFNHIGPGQTGDFVVPAFLDRISRALAAGESYISVGDIESQRDFTDVRDVARAYRTLLESGECGKIYNVCSGRKVRIGALLETCMQVLGANLKCEVDRSLFRPDGTTVRYGSSQLLGAMGWQCEIPLEQSVADTQAFLANHASGQEV